VTPGSNRMGFNVRSQTYNPLHPLLRVVQLPCPTRLVGDAAVPPVRASGLLTL
jgi:hypothetical protein